MSNPYYGFDPACITPQNIHHVSFNGLTYQQMKFVLCQVYDQEYMTPDLVNAIIADLPTCRLVDERENFVRRHASSVDGDWDPFAPLRPLYVDKHDDNLVRRFKLQPGVNDKMSGAVGPTEIPLALATNDNIDCMANLESLLTHMPFRIIEADELATEYGLFNKQFEVWWMLKMQNCFMTTLYGVHRAVAECLDMDIQDYDWDTVLLGSIAIRSGYYDSRTFGERSIVYPEDALPYIQGAGSLMDLCDDEYWDAVYNRSNTWTTMPELPPLLPGWRRNNIR